MERARAALVALVAWAVGSVAAAQPAPCGAAPTAPSFRAPDWADELEGHAAPSESEARARVQRWEAAVRASRRDDPESGESLRQLAEAQRFVYRATDDRSVLEDAIRTYARVIRDYPQHPKTDLVLFRLAWGLEQMQQLDRARQVYHRLIRVYPSSPYVAVAYLSFAEHYWREGDLQAAQQFYQRAASMDAGSVGAYARYMEAWCHHRSGRPAQARSSVSAAREQLRESASATARALARAIERDACALAP